MISSQQQACIMSRMPQRQDMGVSRIYKKSRECCFARWYFLNKNWQSFENAVWQELRGFRCTHGRFENAALQDNTLLKKSTKIRECRIARYYTPKEVDKNSRTLHCTSPLFQKYIWKIEHAAPRDIVFLDVYLKGRERCISSHQSFENIDERSRTSYGKLWLFSRNT